jgi:transcriptional regulator with XRE-family HTH domain
MNMRTRYIDPAEERVGERIRYYRQLRRMSLRTLGGLVGKDHRTIGRMESGEVSCDNRHTLAAIAEALGRPLTDLTGVPTIGGQDGAMLVAGVTRTVNAFVEADLDFPGERALLRPLDALAEDVAAAVRLRVACEYGDLTRMMPALVGSLHAAATIGPDEERKRALKLFVEAAEAGSMGVRYAGNTGSAAMIAERAWYAAQLAGDPESVALAAWARAHAALGCGLNERAAKLAQAGADRLRPLSETAMPMLGMLLLTASFAQAGAGRYGESVDPLAEAAQLAERTGETRKHGLFFGPTNVTFWRVAIQLDGGEPDAAVQLGNGVNPVLIPSASRQATFHADLGRALARLGNQDAAVRQIRAARRIAPLRIDHDPFVQETVRGLVDSAHRAAGGNELRNLAEQMKIAV